MLKKVNRLKKHYQFNYVYKHGTSYSGHTMVVYATPSQTKNIKVGFAVTKKIGNAVKRNLIRRRLREIVFPEIQNLKQNYNLILIAKENAYNASFDELQREFRKLITKANLYDKEDI